MSFPLHAAVASGKEGDVKKALEKSDVNGVDGDSTFS